MVKKSASAAVIAAGVLWGTISFFIRALSKGGLDSLQISSVRLVVAAIVFTAFIALRSPGKLRIRLRDCWMFIGTGIISVVLFNCLYFYTMIKSQPSAAVVLLYTSPIFIMLLSAVLFGEKITPRKLIALAFTVCGCVLVAGIRGGSTGLTAITLLTGIGSGFFYALYTIFARAALKKYDNMTVTAYTFIFGATGSMFFARPQSTVLAVSESPALVFWCVGIGVLCTVLPYFLYTWGLERMESGRAAILSTVEPMVGAFIGMSFLGDDRSAFKILGIFLIIFSVVLLGADSKREEKNR